MVVSSPITFTPNITGFCLYNPSPSPPHRKKSHLNQGLKMQCLSLLSCLSLDKAGEILVMQNIENQIATEYTHFNITFLISLKQML